MKPTIKSIKFILSSLLLMVWCASTLAIETILIQKVETSKLLGYQLQYSSEDSEQLGIEDILKKQEKDWLFSNKSELGFGFNGKAVWVRFELKNYSSRIEQNIIEIPQATLNQLDVYLLRENGEKEHVLAGFKREFNTRKIKTNNLIIPITYTANETVKVYIRAFAEGPLSIPIRVWNINKFFEHQQEMSIFSGLLLGSLIIMFLYNLFIYLELKEKSYLFLSMYIITLMLLDSSITGFGFQYLWPGNLWLEEKSFIISLSALILFASLFVKAVIQTNKILGQNINFTIYLSILLLIVSLFIPYSWSLNIAIPIVVYSGVVALWVVINILLHGSRVTRYLAVGWSLFLIGFMMFFLSAFNIINNNFILIHSLEIGAVFEILFLSLALIEKINQANEERDDALQNLLFIQQQTTNQLESRVKDRTSEIEEVMIKLELANKQLKELSFVDGLTNLNNRAYFDGTFEAQWKNAQRSQTSLALLFLDIDHFKRLNDLYGHLVGDKCLKMIALTIKEQVVRETDIVARYGGEEFVVLLPHTSIEDAEIVAEKIRKAVARLEANFANEDVSMTISIGVAGVVPESGKSSLDLIRLADLALYKAKKEGRNQVIVADEKMNKTLEGLTQ